MSDTTADPIHTTLVPRNDPDNPYVASVSWRGPEDILDQLITAVTDWVQATDAGRRAWEGSSHDFNVGDLSGEALDEEPLLGILARHGIRDLEIEIIRLGDDHDDWTYDTILVDETALDRWGEGD